MSIRGAAHGLWLFFSKMHKVSSQSSYFLTALWKVQRNFPPGSKKTCRKTRNGKSYELIFYFILFFFLSSSKYMGNLCCRDGKWSPGRKQCTVLRSWACATAEQSRASRRLESLRKSEAEKTGFAASNVVVIVSWQQAPFIVEPSTEAKTPKVKLC